MKPSLKRFIFQRSPVKGLTGMKVCPEIKRDHEPLVKFLLDQRLGFVYTIPDKTD